MPAQPALFKGPGDFSAVQIWRGAADAREVLELANAHVLVAFKSDLPAFLPMAGHGQRFPSTQAEVLIQVGDDTREGMLDHLRRAKLRLQSWCALDEELIGGKIGDGREPFGFRDGLKPPTEKDIQEKALRKDGASYLLYQRYEQSLERFNALRDREQLRVMGITREGHDLKDPPEDAHVQRARQWAHFVRRGFPYRQNATEGLAFIAAGNDPKVFARALEAMLSEPLLRWAEALSGGVYLAPAL